jgi:predicted kinase
MNAETPPRCHLLIGLPGSGKTTLAQQWQQHDPHLAIVSTDTIRTQLYGDPSHQGQWQEIETEILRQIQQAIANQQPIAYDATNAQRPHRLAIIEKIQTHHPAIAIHGWQLTTTLETCQHRNHNRARRVPDDIIEQMDTALRDFPPHLGEGFLSLHPVPHHPDNQPDLAEIDRLIAGSQLAAINRRNRKTSDLHPYSTLRDFDRLMHLLAIVANPTPRDRQPDLHTIIQQFHDRSLGFHADPAAIADDLDWLEQIGLLNAASPNPIAIDDIPQHNPTPERLDRTHRYSDRPTFHRLLNIIQLIIATPFPDRHDPHPSSLEHLHRQLARQLDKTSSTNSKPRTQRHRIRRDLTETLYPYGILRQLDPRTRHPQQTTQQKGRYRRAYYLGTSVLPADDLVWLHAIARQTLAETPSHDHARFQSIERRLRDANLLPEHQPSPLDAIDPLETYDLDETPKTSLRRQLGRLQTAIARHERLQLQTFMQAATYDSEPKPGTPFEIYPLVLTHHNADWYVGSQHLPTADEPDSVFRYTRLDRVHISDLRRDLPTRRLRDHRKARHQLDRLRAASIGLYLGTATEQQRFLSKNRQERRSVQVEFELHGTAAVFRFIQERPQRFGKQTQFVTTDEPAFPHGLRAVLPVWAIEDFDFLRWLLGFGGEVRLVEPKDWGDRVAKIGLDIVEIYDVAAIPNLRI